jgi:hypothetical protein
LASHKKADPLFRGDQADAVSTPHPAADPSLVRHILYLGGYGRESPYLSTSSDESSASAFAAGGGRVWQTSGQRAEQLGTKHISQAELQVTLKSSKTGRARWPNARQRLQARLYVEQHSEHLIDFIPFKKSPATVGQAVQAMFEKA